MIHPNLHDFAWIGALNWRNVLQLPRSSPLQAHHLHQAIPQQLRLQQQLLHFQPLRTVPRHLVEKRTRTTGYLPFSYVPQPTTSNFHSSAVMIGQMFERPPIACRIPPSDCVTLEGFESLRQHWKEGHPVPDMGDHDGKISIMSLLFDRVGSKSH